MQLAVAHTAILLASNSSSCGALLLWPRVSLPALPVLVAGRSLFDHSTHHAPCPLSPCLSASLVLPPAPPAPPAPCLRGLPPSFAAYPVTESE